MNQPVKTCLALGTLLVLFAYPSKTVGRGRDHDQATTPSFIQQEPSSPQNPVQILTPTDGVDFKPYTDTLVRQVRKKWFASMPEAALKGEKGEAIVRFRIRSDGNIGGVTVEVSSGKDAFDRAATQAILDSSPFDPLPLAFRGSSISLRFVFYYNVRPAPDETVAGIADCGDIQNATSPEGPFDRLELLAFASHTFDNAYAKRTICRRGIDFSPDADALKGLQIDGLPAMLVITVGQQKPKTINDPSADRKHAYISLRLALNEQGGSQAKAADVDFKRALDYAPNSAALHATYAGYLLSQKRFSEAEVQSRRSLEIWPDNADARVMMATALTSEGKSEQAVPEAREALRLDPEHKSGVVILGFSLSASGQFAEAIPVLRQSLHLSSQLPIIHKFLGSCLVHTRDFDAAIPELTTFLTTNARDADAHYLLGVAYREKEDSTKAEIQFHEALRIEPTNAIYLVAVSKVDPLESKSAEAKLSAPKPDDGFVSGNVYTNSFFGFSYQFPNGWVVLDPEKGKSLSRLGGSLLAGTDPVYTDAVEAGASNSYSLLFVGKETTKDISVHLNLVEIQALDERFFPREESGEDYLSAMMKFGQNRFQALHVAGKPEQITVGTRTFWKIRASVTLQNQMAHVVEALTIEKGYMLLFIFGTPDESKLDDLAGTLFTIHSTNPQ